ncbi:MAG: chemotaxis protein CheW [Bacillota bacterium]|nr:chemotaxis protein CheW [Negativicutes bacterium]
MDEEQLVVFRLGDEEYAVPAAQVKEIIQYAGITAMPDTPEFVEGITDLRGNIIPVIGLAKRFGLPDGEGSDKRVIIIEVKSRELGVIVDEVTEIKKLAQAAIEAAPSITAKGDYICGIGKDNDRLLILLDVDKLFSLNEMVQLKELISSSGESC